MFGFFSITNLSKIGFSILWQSMSIVISTIFEYLQDQRKTFLAEWSLQQTTLESVFLKIALEAEKKEGEGEDDGSV